MITAIAIDDEPNALEILTIHANKIPFLDIKKTFRDALEAIDWLQHHSIDLVLLDINMPHLSGLQFKEMIPKNILVIFTTAYSEYAVESYQLNALDYLLKPIRFERFLQSILKAKHVLKTQSILAESSSNLLLEHQNASQNWIYIKSGTKLFKLDSTNIFYLEKEGNYIIFHTSNQKKILSRLNMAQVLDLLPDKDFMKIHKSYITSLRHIEVVEPHQITVQDIKLPVAKTYRNLLLERLKTF